jgi:ketosteroid isomerase-like protein
MTQQSLEVVQAWMLTFPENPDAFRDTLHPEIEWFPFEENHTRYHGIEQAMQVRRQWLETWDEIQAVPEALFQDGDTIIVTIHVTARGRSSGAETDVRLHLQFEVRDGRVVYLFEHADRASALEAAGLSEQDARDFPSA